MNKFAALMALCFFLAGCAEQIYGNQLSWRPKNYSGAPYVITSKFDHEVWLGGNTLHLFVNGDEVITRELSHINNSGSFVSKYKSHMVSVDCRQSGAEVLCDVFIDSEKVGTF